MCKYLKNSAGLSPPHLQHEGDVILLAPVIDILRIKELNTA
jgi:hypothetical protein